MCSCQEFREKSPKDENHPTNLSSSETQQKSRQSPHTDSNIQSDKSKPSFGNSSGTSAGFDQFEKVFDDDRDPFFSTSTKKNKRFRPRLSEKLFGHQSLKHPFFNDPQAYFEDLRKDFGKKMYFDDVDSFGFPSEPQSAGTGSHRMRRAGFPFDDIRSTSARSRLDDLASRHPMFSTMGSPNSWQDIGDMGRWGQRGRNNSGGAGSTCSSGAASGSSTASCGEEHVIPIKIVHGNSSNAEATAGRTSSPSNTNNTDTNTPPEPPKRKQQPLGPQRSATDNSSYKKSGGESPSAQGQGRSQRAQSAPPDGAPIGQTGTPQGTQLGGNSSKSKQNVGAGGVRHIPIFVEGRDSPVIATDASVGSPSQQNQSAPVFNSSPPKPSRPAEHSPTPPPKKPTPPKDPIEKVQAVSEEVKALEEKVKEFTGDSRKDKNYIYLDEMLTRNLIKLDDIETEGRDDVRTARKDCIKLINSCIALLESKIPPSVSENGTQMEVEEVVLEDNANAKEENPSKEHVTTVVVEDNSSGTLPLENPAETPNV